MDALQPRAATGDPGADPPEDGPLFALTRNGNPVARARLGGEAAGPDARPVTIGELQPIGFAIERRSPEIEYEVSIGDVPLGAGTPFGPHVYWADAPYLESTRGRVSVHLRDRAAGSEGPWRERARLDVTVVPTKLSEAGCAALEEDIRRVSADLVFDLVSKMLRGVRYARGLQGIESRSIHVELGSLRDLWRELSALLDRIDADPHLHVGRRVRPRACTGADVLDPHAAAWLAARGFDPRSRNAPWPVTIPGRVLAKTSDTVEHRLMLGFLRLLLAQVGECVDAARRQIERIEADREWRHVALGDGPTLYEEVDLPKIERLRDAVRQGAELAAQIRRSVGLPLFQGLAPQHGAPDTPVFTHVAPYYRFARAMRGYLASSLVVLEAGADERLKETSRLYEHWVFLRLAEAFRAAGLRGDDVEGVVRRLSRHRFVLDLDDDMIVTFRVDDRRRVRVRYEPWILSADAARRRGDLLCRGAGAGPAWRPDVLIEFIDGRDVDYAVVVDSKYSKRIQDHHWARVEKYTRIRTVEGLRQVVRQVWLAHPGDPAGIRCRDSFVGWTDAGPDRPRDEFVLGELGLRPAPGVAGGDGGSGEAAAETAPSAGATAETVPSAAETAPSAAETVPSAGATAETASSAAETTPSAAVAAGVTPEPNPSHVARAFAAGLLRYTGFTAGG